MKTHDHTQPRDVQASNAARRARLQALLCMGAALGTTLITLVAAAEPKLPPFYCE